MSTNTILEQQNALSKGEIILYQTADDRTSIDVKLENEIVWLTQAQMAMLLLISPGNPPGLPGPVVYR